ncbi:MAG: DUF3108 domain-containing protein [Moraxellaceae bacterium]|nr:DUF3108 domain-containing protein [Moraxellaceae bacterium]
MKLSRPLLTALVISSLLHIAPFIELNWREWFVDTEDEVLESSEADEVERVQLALTPAEEVLLTPQLVFYSPAPPSPVVTKPTAEAAPVRIKPKTEAIATNTVAEALTQPLEDSGIEDVYEPPATFPVSVQAIHSARYRGVRLRLQQQWMMEGRDYFIRNDARKFGFAGLITSAGKVSPEGLKPESFRLMLNNDMQQFADIDYTNDVMTHGRSARQRRSSLNGMVFQDMASLPFHVAVSYEGKAERELMVTTGSSIYKIVLRVVANERLRLPGGEIETIHLTGTRQNDDGKLQGGYDIWLAPSLRNYPVRFTGPDSRGNLLEMSLLQVDFDGRRVFGRDSVDDEFDEHEQIPIDLLQQHGYENVQPITEQD